MDQSIEMLKEEALQRMQMSQEFTKFLRKAYDIFGDPEALIGKNITPATFWFFIDALYYYTDPNQHSANIRQLTTEHSQNTEQFAELQDLQFILKLRKLISEQKMGTLNIQDIRSTPLDEVIDIAQAHLYHTQKQNNQKLEMLVQKQQKQQQKIVKELDRMKIKFINSHPMFYYEQLQAVLRAKWIQQEIKEQNRQRCYLCLLPNKLITCNTCSLKVHDTCYPTFAYRFQNKALKPTEQELRDFICENCRNKVDIENQKCQLCCCVGGHFVKTYQQDDNFKIKFNKENLSQENIKNTYIGLKIIQYNTEKVQKYVHLSCSIWNTDLKWNSTAHMIQGLHKTTKKKSNGACSLCGISYGAVIPCSNDTCRRFYHAECAKRHKLEMKLIRAKTPVIELFCQRHRHLNKHESLQQAQIHRFREVKKMFQGMDKQIKRLNVTSSYQQVKLVVERDYCSVCGKEENRQKSTICKQCRKWYHNYCSQNCKNCH